MKDKRPPTLTRQTMSVLSTLIERGEPLAGSIIASATSLASGSLYPILIRLEDAKWIQSEWEEKQDGSTESATRRRLYSMTSLGSRRVREEAKAWKRLVESIV